MAGLSGILSVAAALTMAFASLTCSDNFSPYNHSSDILASRVVLRSLSRAGVMNDFLALDYG